LAGHHLDNDRLQRLRQSSHFDLSLLLNGEVYASSLAAEDSTTLSLAPETLAKLLTSSTTIHLHPASQAAFISAISLPGQEDNDLQAVLLLSHRQALMQRTRDDLGKHFLLLSLVIVVIAIAVISLYCRAILKPLQELSITAVAVGRGERAKRLTISSGDEFQLMASHFNTMLDVLEGQDQALRNYSQSLEERIQLRTDTLQEQNSFITSILKSSTSMAIAATDLDLKILYFNPMAEQVFGYESRETIGRTVLEMHERLKIDPSRFARAVAAVKERGTYSFQMERELDGQPQFIDGTLSAIRDDENNINGYLLLASDVTAWKMMEARIKNALAELNIIFDNGAQAITFIRDHIITQVNSKFEQLFGFSRQEVIGQHRLKFWSRLFHGDYERFWLKR